MMIRNQLSKYSLKNCFGKPNLIIDLVTIILIRDLVVRIIPIVIKMDEFEKNIRISAHRLSDI
jgi:uncharacterized Zn ribbon protein